MSFFSNFSPGWQNVVNTDGVKITVSGIILVFICLAMISMIIGLTPHLLKMVNRFFPEQEEPLSGKKEKTISETEVVAAISAALHRSMRKSND